jgi:hypothetical protein
MSLIVLMFRGSIGAELPQLQGKSNPIRPSSE